MQANQKPLRRERSFNPRAVLATTVVVIFLLLHVVAGAILHGAAARDGGQAMPVSTLQPYD